MDYSSQTRWLDIQAYLPSELHFAPGYTPEETWWEWQGHNVHLDCFRNPTATAKVILFHGVGTNGRQMSSIVGGPLAKLGYETVAIDMPTYGQTIVRPGALVTYDDWVAAAQAIVSKESKNDERPIFLYGLSAGGMLCYHVAALGARVRGIIGMTFLDQREQRVRDETSLTPLFGRLGGPMIHASARSPLRGMRIPMRLVGKMSALVNNEYALTEFLKDKTSAGNWVTMKFISSYLHYQPAVEPAIFDACPILLTQPAADRWSPLHLSTLFLSKVSRVPVSIVMLENAGHYPLEEPGLSRLPIAIDEFIRNILSGTVSLQNDAETSKGTLSKVVPHVLEIG